MKNIPFNLPHISGKELEYIVSAFNSGRLSGGGGYTNKTQALLETQLEAKKVLLTHSGTAALEMAAMLSRVSLGDEVIMPSFTFVSTANAFVLRGAKPVFVDIREDTLNIDNSIIEQAITKSTRAIVPVHYAGVACEMDSIQLIAKQHNLLIIEDAAQGYMSKYKNKFLGTIGDFGAVSFHETKNIISGEGGALIINRDKFINRSEVIWEKGTNRRKYFRGEVDKYTWVDIGSSFLPSEITAAFLLAQLENTHEITKKRIRLWDMYYDGLKDLEEEGKLRLPVSTLNTTQNGHIFYILLSSFSQRSQLISYLRKHNILSVFHYVPLHSSPAGKKYGRLGSSMNVTNSISDKILRLPLFYNLSNDALESIVVHIHNFFKK